jgi:hypothetical protein
LWVDGNTAPIRRIRRRNATIAVASRQLAPLLLDRNPPRLHRPEFPGKLRQAGVRPKHAARLSSGDANPTSRSNSAI